MNEQNEKVESRISELENSVKELLALNRELTEAIGLLAKKDTENIIQLNSVLEQLDFKTTELEKIAKGNIEICKNNFDLIGQLSLKVSDLESRFNK